MITSRPARRVAAVVVAAAGLLILMATPALADVPEGWSNPKHVSAIDWLLVLLLIPIGAAVVITLIVALPGLIKGQGFTGGQQEPAEGASSERPGAH